MNLTAKMFIPLYYTKTMQLLFAIIILCMRGFNCETVIRQTRYGPVVGVLSDISQQFLGIPFAAPARR